jgi:hypothetical protein
MKKLLLLLPLLMGCSSIQNNELKSYYMDCEYKMNMNNGTYDVSKDDKTFVVDTRDVLYAKEHSECHNILYIYTNKKTFIIYL